MATGGGLNSDDCDHPRLCVQGLVGPLYRLFVAADGKVGMGKSAVEYPTSRIERAQ